MSRQLAYPQKITNSLQEGPKSFKQLKAEVRTDTGNQISAKVLTHNLSALQDQGKVEKYYIGWRKYPLYKLSTKEKTAVLKDTLTCYINAEESQTNLNPDQAVFVLSKEDNVYAWSEPTFVRSTHPLGRCFKNRSLPDPQTLAENLILRRIEEGDLDALAEFYAKLVFLGFLLELREPNMTIDAGVDLSLYKKMSVPLMYPSGKTLKARLKNQEVTGIIGLVHRNKDTRTIIELQERLLKQLKDDGTIVTIIFGYLMQRAATFLGFDEHTKLHESSRVVILKALYKNYDELIRSEVWAERDPSMSFQERTKQEKAEGFLKSLKSIWSIRKLTLDLRRQEEATGFLKSLMKPLNMVYIWAPFLGESYLTRLEDSEEASSFEYWFERLKNGDLDHHNWLFTGSMEKALQSFIGWLRKQSAEVISVPLERDFQIDFEPYMRVGFLFNNHSRGKTVDLYLEILEAIKQRKEYAIKIKAPPSQYSRDSRVA